MINNLNISKPGNIIKRKISSEYNVKLLLNILIIKYAIEKEKNNEPLLPKKTLFLKLRYRKRNNEKIIGKNNCKLFVISKNTINKYIEYNPVCKLIPSNILNAFINSKNESMVKNIEKSFNKKSLLVNEKLTFEIKICESTRTEAKIIKLNRKSFKFGVSLKISS